MEQLYQLSILVTLTKHYWMQWNLTLDAGLVPTPHPLKPLSSFFLRNFKLQVTEWKVLMGHSNSVNNFTRLQQFKAWKKSHFTSNHTGPTNLHEWCCDKFRILVFHKDYFKIFLTIWNWFAKTAAFSKMLCTRLSMKLLFSVIIFQEAL